MNIYEILPLQLVHLLPMSFRETTVAARDFAAITEGDTETGPS